MSHKRPERVLAEFVGVRVHRPDRGLLESSDDLQPQQAPCDQQRSDGSHRVAPSSRLVHAHQLTRVARQLLPQRHWRPQPESDQQVSPPSWRHWPPQQQPVRVDLLRLRQ